LTEGLLHVLAAVRTTGVTWERGGEKGLRSTNAPPIFFIPETVFLTTELKKAIKKIGARVGEGVYVCVYVCMLWTGSTNLPLVNLSHLPLVNLSS